MKRRKLGSTEYSVGEIGMGTEYLLDKDAQTVGDTIRAALDSGVTYIDCHPGHDNKDDITDYEGYHKLGKAIRGARDKLCITYLAASRYPPSWTEPRFGNYLKAMDTDHTDIFLLQFCDKVKDYEAITGKNGLLEYAVKLRAEGKIRHIGISTHSSAVALRAIDSKIIEVLMYPVNPAFDAITDEEQYKTDDLGTLWDAAQDYKAAGSNAQPRRSVYSECEHKGIGLVAMKPFGGGFVFQVEKEAGFTPVNLVSYALAQNGVSVVVPGCSKPGEILEILAYNTCTDSERDYSAAVAKSRWSIPGNCQYCNHCLPCGAGINIGGVNRLIDAVDYDSGLESAGVREKYAALPVRASACTECGTCMERCPFGVKVTERMKRAVKIFESAGGIK